MKKAQIKIAIIIIMFLSFLIPSISYGAEFSMPVSGLNNAQAWFTGIFAAMRHYQGGWIDTPAPFAIDPGTGRVMNYGEWGDENYSWKVFDTGLASRFPGETGNISFMRSVGGLCYGHQYTNNYGKAIVPKMVVTIDNPNSSLFHNYEMQILAYSIKNAWQNHEVGTAANQKYKAAISKWINERAGNYGILIQDDEGYLSNLDQIQAEGYGDINGMANEKFQTASTGGEGATQSIEYKNGNTFIGPYNLNTSWGNLTDATITLRDNAGTINTSYGSLDGTNIIPLSQISEYNGNSFYIVVQGQEVESVAKIDLRKYYRYNGVRIIAGEGTGQNMAVFYGEERWWTATLPLPEVPYSNIKIRKLDEDTNKPLPEPVGFIVYNETLGKWVKEGTKVEYVDNKEDATTYYTDANGEVTIKNLSEKGKYIVYEVVNPNFGYEAATYDDPSQEVVTEIASLGQNSELTIYNKRKYIKVSGYVWEDIITSKQSVRNNLYDSAEELNKRVNNVTVNLRKANGELIDSKVTGTIINSNGEQESGAYLFGDYESDANAVKIQISDLEEGAYIEFEYNGMSYKSVDVYPENSDGRSAQDYEATRGKATDDNFRENFNQNFATVTNNHAETGNYTLNYDFANYTSTLNYGGNYLYGYDGQTFPVSGIDSQYMITANTKDAEQYLPSNGNDNIILGQLQYSLQALYDQYVTEIKNINLGLYAREMPDLRVTNDIQNAIVSINGYGHLYNYAATSDRSKEDADNMEMGVKFGTERGSQKYTREVYKSDYDFESDEDGLQVYITYKISIKNEATNLSTKINSLTNYYDRNYELVGAGTDVNEEGNIINELNCSVDQNYNDGTYAKVVIDTNNIIEAQKEEYVYIQFHLDRETLGEILFDANGEPVNDPIMLENIAEVNSYSSYANLSDAEQNIPYAGIDKDSNPGSATPGEITTYEDDTDKAPGMQIVITNPRVISGTVFVDSTPADDLTGQERLGSGIFEDGETTIKGVTVTLTEQLEEGETGPARTYQTTTDSNGNFEIGGFIPDKYTLTYTWGDEGYSVRDYKATIYLAQERQNDLHWYLYEYDKTAEEKTRYSDAFDNYETRKAIDAGYEATYEEGGDIPTMMDSTTPLMEFGVELNDIYQNYAPTDGQDKIQFNISKMDFGIVERARQIIGIDKRVSHINIRLANGMALVDADIVDNGDGTYSLENGTQYVTFMPEQGTGFGQNGFVRAEIDTELIQGATITVTYEISVRNDSELDYSDEDYYNYGQIAEADKADKIIKITPSGVYDYLDSEMTKQEDGTNTWEVISDKTTYDSRLEEKPTVLENYYYQEYKRINESGSGEVTTVIGYEEFANQYSQAIASWTKENVQTARRSRLADYTVLHNTNLEGEIAPGNKNTAYLTSSKVLSNTDEIELDNHAEIVEITRNQETGRDVTTTFTGYYNAAETVTVTGPTGENNNYIPYIVLGLSSLVIVVAGIVFIKKKIIG